MHRIEKKWTLSKYIFRESAGRMLATESVLAFHSLHPQLCALLAANVFFPSRVIIFCAPAAMLPAGTHPLTPLHECALYIFITLLASAAEALSDHLRITQSASDAEQETCVKQSHQIHRKQRTSKRKFPCERNESFRILHHQILRSDSPCKAITEACYTGIFLWQCPVRSKTLDKNLPCRFPQSKSALFRYRSSVPSFFW